MKISDKGFWVSKVYKWMSVVYWSLYSIYFRTLTYFSVANPKIYLGGMLDDRKSDIYQLVPSRYLPKMRMYSSNIKDSIDEIMAHFDFPIIIKPNVGFKGFMVTRIDTAEELVSVAQQYSDMELLVQEFINESHEFSVMYYYVNEHDYGISSLVEKDFPTVWGDGIMSLQQLIDEMNNPFVNKEWILKKNKNALNRIIEKGAPYTVDHVGNYSRGSKFKSLNHQIDQQLIQSVNSFYQGVQGMFFCRMDVKAHSLEELKKGNFKLLEINGAKSEPLHIYDPDVSIWQTMKDIHRHWAILFRIVKKNINLMDFPSSREGIKSYYSLKKMVS